MRPDAPATATRQGVEEDAAAAVVFTDMSILQKREQPRNQRAPRAHGAAARPP
jgi:hypothetical protein